MDSRRLFCIVGPGRSGSSLLAAVLARAGADFGLPVPETTWDPGKGILEHSACHESYKYLSRVERLRESLLPETLCGGAYFQRAFLRSLQKLRDVDFAKSSTMVWLVPHLTHVGRAPSVVVSFRRFQGYAASRHRKWGWDFEKLEQNYCNVYKTAWLEVQTYGGVVIDYDDVLDRSTDSWITALAQLTHLEKDRILAARNELVRARSPGVRSEEVRFSDEIARAEELLVTHKNRVYPSS